PYARTTGVNGDRAMVIDLASTNPEGWEDDTYVTQENYTDAIIWELHVRDFSIDESSGMNYKGKYLAFTENGTTVPGTDISTGVDYMKELGINYVHLLPVYDINSVDETVGGYNWGYDPKNYNVPEGSYSTDPYNGAVRVNEFKQMVQALHDAEIGVIMDVVYNHVADAGNFCFNRIVPGYFSRIHDDGSYQSNSGCGNDTASERAMVRKYIVDSVLYWAEEYHIDGFRWDLVGLIDYETINEVMAAVHAVNPNIIFYGEGWEMCSWTTKDGYVNKMTIQPNDDKVNTEAGTFAFFNDTIRNVIHGGVFTASDKGFVYGNMNAGTKQTVIEGYMGNSTWGSNGGSVDTPLQTVNYASCHDNYTLFDNLTIDARDYDDCTVEEIPEFAYSMNQLAAAYYITAQGVPFIHAGEEMLRSKPDAQQETGFNHNSYASGDEINSIKWSVLKGGLEALAHDYYQGLIAFRAAHPAMRMTTEAEIQAAMSVIPTDSNNVVALLNKGGNGEDAEIISIFNAFDWYSTVELPEGTWDVYVDDKNAGTEVLYSVEGSVDVAGTSAMILVKHEGEVVDPVKDIEVETTNVAKTGKFKMTWQAVEGAVKYEIFRTQDEGGYERMYTTSNTSYINTNAQVGRFYTYLIYAWDENGELVGMSDVIDGHAILARPQITSASNVAKTGKVKLTWEKVEDAVAYKIYRSTSKDGSYKLMYTTSGTSYTNTKAEAGVTYYYKVVAVAKKAQCDSVASAVKSRTCDLPQPKITGTVKKSGDPKLTWEKVEGAVAYKVYRATSNGSFKLMYTTSNTTYTNTNNKAGTTYRYYVVAVAENTWANSAASNTVKLTAK
ncbi:MAG: type I pullulanase, partial [Oscillospiraceae bacterium]|nr:type I pullulanase [Oscillospiraceae bacterium]